MRLFHKMLGFVLGLVVLCPSMIWAKSTLQDGAVRKWAELAALEIMNFDFMSFDNKKAENAHYFTQKGYESFYNAMDNAKIPEAVKQNKLLLQSSLQCPPEIKEKRDEKGKTVWGIEFVLALDYISGKDMSKDMQKVFLRLKEDPTVKNEDKIGIDQWVASPIPENDKAVCGSKEQTKVRIGQLRREIAAREAEIKALEAQLP